VNLPDAAQKGNKAKLQKGDAALAKVIQLQPDSQDAHLFKAKINQSTGTNESYKTMAESYDEYIKIVTAKGASETAKPNVKSNLIDAYSNAAAYYAVTNKAKAVDYFNKALALDPNDQYAKAELKKLQ